MLLNRLNKKESSIKKLLDKLKKYVYSAGNTDDLMTQYVRYRGSEPKIEPLLEKRGLDEF